MFPPAPVLPLIDDKARRQRDGTIRTSIRFISDLKTATTCRAVSFGFQSPG